MLNIVTIILLGISLSMDAFSLSLVYGTSGIGRNEKLIISLIVGIFHFFMPLLGSLFGSIVFSYFTINTDILIGVIFGFIGVDMIVSFFKEDNYYIISSMLGYIFFAFSVSIDSFTTGIGLYVLNNNYCLISSIFMLCSGLFTYLGLCLGSYLNYRFGKYANIVGGIIFIFLLFYYLF